MRMRRYCGTTHFVVSIAKERSPTPIECYSDSVERKRYILTSLGCHESMLMKGIRNAARHKDRSHRRFDREVNEGLRLEQCVVEG